MNLTKVPDWVVIGGSYPGALSAWFKSKYPNAAKAAWSSSGVIHVFQDFYQNDLDVMLSTNLSGWECPKLISQYSFDVQRVKKFGTAEQIQTLADWMNITNATELQTMNDGDFAYMIADIGTGFVQNGRRTELCKQVMDKDF